MLDNNIEVYKKELHIDDEKNYEIVKRTIMTKEQAIDFELPKINIVDKFAIKYNDYYLTKIFFNITDDDWYTDRIDEIPDDMLFDGYNEADNCLLVICANHRLINRHVSIAPVRKPEMEDLK